MIFQFLKRIDLYGKEPEFYFKGKSSKTTWMGRILTILYVIIYIAFLIYKLNRMIKRKDVTFYDTNAYTGEIPSIHLDREIFYGAFAFDDPISSKPYWDPRIYNIKAEYVSQVKINGEWNTSRTEVPFKRCELSDFGSKYQSILANKDLSGFLCPTTIDFVLEGYTTLERYSYIKMNFKRCVNSSDNGNHCFPMDVIQQYLYATSIDSKIEDIELTPQDHDNPIQYLERDIPGPTYQYLFQYIYVYMQLVIIETDDNIIGFEALSNTKTEKHLKYDTSWIVSSPILFGDFSVNPDADLNDITIQLSPNVLTQKRTYVQLIDVLGDVGGLMEIVNMIFSIICSFVGNILYEKSLVNNLFNFDLDRKIIILKKRKNKKINYENKDEQIMKDSNKHINNVDNNENTDKNGELNLNKKMENNENITIKKQRKRTNNSKKSLIISQSNVDIYQKNNNNMSSKRNIYDINENNNKNNYLNEKISYKEEKNIEKIYDKENEYSEQKERSEKNKNFINKININRLSINFGFCCVRSISNVNNFLMDEGMKLITEQLDILNLFRKLFEESINQNKLKDNIITKEMSDECKKNVAQKLRENINNSVPSIG